MKLKASLVVLGLLFLLTVSAHAQSGILPCGGEDPDVACPLDTWVVILVAASAVFAVFTLLKRKKAQSSLLNSK